ncbi:hypothetical protein RIF29_39506 [Crotalaria pallida]|uniref:Uncharacterized protein n=1 Tax=Crotalaria pallida TaxID=3830 RepID=A0AAN9HPU6_CROPI
MLTQAPSQAQSETSADIQLALSNPLYCKTSRNSRGETGVPKKTDAAIHSSSSNAGPSATQDTTCHSYDNLSDT